MRFYLSTELQLIEANEYLKIQIISFQSLNLKFIIKY